MSLTELSAFETAYQILAPLDEPARRRALQWLSDALADKKPLAGNSVNGSDSHPQPIITRPAVAKPAASTPRRQRATAATTAAVRNRKRKAAAKPMSSSTGREYRRMPDPDDVMAAYAEVGTVSGLAEHFDVPQHTVTHWARRLRSLGYSIGRNA